MALHLRRAASDAPSTTKTSVRTATLLLMYAASLAAGLAFLGFGLPAAGGRDARNVCAGGDTDLLATFALKRGRSSLTANLAFAG